MSAALEYLQNLEPSRKLVLAIVGPLLILLVYYVFMLGPRVRQSAETRADIESMVAERQLKIAEAEQMPDLVKGVEALDTQLKVAITRLPDEKEIPELLSAISNLGRDSGLDILIFRQKPEGYQEFYAEVPVEMQVRGGYHQVATFLDRVGKLDRIVNVSNIVIKEPKVLADDLILEASSQVTTFRFLSEPERQRLIKEKKIKGDAK